MHVQISRSGGQSEARSPVFKSPSKLGTHLSSHCTPPLPREKGYGSCRRIAGAPVFRTANSVGISRNIPSRVMTAYNKPESGVFCKAQQWVEVKVERL
ncbi:hypothetical protein TNCV_4163981 [Trichonephila clavipes]|nr:hypothetical protein TNCV_4163981 [Trichonephila clavipes]